jgi:DNA-binding IclR family transcriptional regulator
LDPSERIYLYAVDGLPSYTENTITDPEVLEREIECIQQCGYAVEHFERFETWRGVAVPVFGLDGEPLLAMLAIGSMQEDSQQDATLARQMQEVAREMSDLIAVQGDMPKASTEFAKYNLE